MSLWFGSMFKGSEMVEPVIRFTAFVSMSYITAFVSMSYITARLSGRAAPAT